MAGSTKNYCFVCLKSFKPPAYNNDKHSKEEEPARPSPKGWKMFSKFVQILTKYLNFSVDLPSQLNCSVFCSSCESGVNTINGIYEELRLVEIRLCNVLGVMGETMNSKPIKIPKGLVKSLADQLMIQEDKGGSSYVEKIRNGILLKFMLKGRKGELLESVPQPDKHQDDDEEDEEPVIKTEVEDNEKLPMMDDDTLNDFDSSFLYVQRLYMKS